MANPLLVLRDISIAAAGKPLLEQISLQVYPGEVHALIGPNGAGKSSLLYALAGHPDYAFVGGNVMYQGLDLAALSPEERAHKGLFLAFQQPPALPGVRVSAFLQAILQADRRSKGLEQMKPVELVQQIKKALAKLSIPSTFLTRHMHDAFSGGEKKQLELLQLYLIAPTLALLDEMDAGLDVDALQRMCTCVKEWHEPQRSLLLVTHYTHVLSYIEPDWVHLIHKGKIKKSGGAELAHELLTKGYASAASLHQPI